jgi:aspartate/methionine/tyrosine aminotransferase
VRDQLRKRAINQIEHNLGIAHAFFKRWPDLFTWQPPMAGSTALVGMNVPSVMDFAVILAEKAGVLIHPAKTLGSDDQHMRMGFGRAGFERALNEFEKFLNKYNPPEP